MLRNRIALTFALTRVRFSLPFRAAMAMHLGSSVLWLASVPQESYVSTASGIDSQPSSTHLASLDLCLGTSVAKAPDPACCHTRFR